MTLVEPYYVWQMCEADLFDAPMRWMGKPGLESWDAISPPVRLLAQELSVEAGQRLLDLRCGTGVCGALAARRGARVTLCDDAIVSVHAARWPLGAAHA